MIWLFVDIEHADWHAKPGPNAVVIYAGGHNHDQHFGAIWARNIDHLKLHRLLGLALALAPDHFEAKKQRSEIKTLRQTPDV